MTMKRENGKTRVSERQYTQSARELNGVIGEGETKNKDEIIS